MPPRTVCVYCLILLWGKSAVRQSRKLDSFVKWCLQVGFQMTGKHTRTGLKTWQVEFFLATCSFFSSASRTPGLWTNLEKIWNVRLLWRRQVRPIAVPRGGMKGKFSWKTIIQMHSKLQSDNPISFSPSISKKQLLQLRWLVLPHFFGRF